MAILVTGGAGYIGSHTVLALLEAGHEVVVFDNLVNSSTEALKRVAQLTGRTPIFIQGDVRNEPALNQVFAEHSIEAVIHFAGLKAVGESVAKPLEYYDVNVQGSLTLVRAMQQAGVKKIVFSSSATVYGEEAPVPYKETMPRGTTTNPYGTSKAMVEQILTDWQQAHPDWTVVILRYFNPIGAHRSGLIGEDPQDIPNNLMPYVAQVAVGRREKLSVFGNDYNTPDGTGVRDYIHVVDLAQGHLAALAVDNKREHQGCEIFNLGTGQGTSVLELVQAFERASGVEIPYEIVPRRPGDLATCYADASRAADVLGWRAELNLTAMVEDTWRWQSKNPLGYQHENE